MFKPVQFVLVVIFSVIIVACVGTTNSENVNEYLDSAAVTKQVKTKLIDKLGTPGFGIKVRVYRDEVLLTGIVENRTMRQQAGEIAASVDNVKHVRNDLVVR